MVASRGGNRLYSRQNPANSLLSQYKPHPLGSMARSTYDTLYIAAIILHPQTLKTREKSAHVSAIYTPELHSPVSQVGIDTRALAPVPPPPRAANNDIDVPLRGEMGRAGCRSFASGPPRHTGPGMGLRVRDACRSESGPCFCAVANPPYINRWLTVG